MVDQVIRELGRLDILVCNAGINWDGVIWKMSEQQWDQVIAVNLTSTFHLSRAVLRGMMKKRWGRIIGITSIVGVTGNPGQGNYAAAKAGMIGMSKSLAAEVGSRGITVNCIAPGPFQSKMMRATLEVAGEQIAATNPMRRIGRDEDMAGTAIFLASPAAAYITGAILPVDGGMYTTK